MSSVRVLDHGVMDNRDSAFPQAVELPDGDVLCSFSVGGGATVTGGTDWARSRDGGRTWRLEGTLCPAPADSPRANFLKLSRSAKSGTVFAYGASLLRQADRGFGHRDYRPILCTSRDEGRTWSEPRDVPMPPPAPYEVSHGVLCLKSGRLLAPAATLGSGRLGESVVVAISDDDGQTWPRHGVALRDPQGRHGFFEQKLTQLPDGRVLCVGWTVTLGEVADRCDHYAISKDDGLTWSEPRATDVMGQTMTPLALDERRLLVLYNRRYGRQGVVMQIVDFTREQWDVTWEGMLYDPGTERQRDAGADGLTELDTFAFGFPTAIRLRDGAILATWWAKPAAVNEVRWARLEIVG